MIPSPAPHLFPAKLPERADALLVLRDWLEQHTARRDLDRLSEWALCAYGRELGAPVELVAQAQAETEAPVRKTFDPEELANAVRLRHIRARTGLLVKAQIVLALERHIEALHLAAEWGRELEAVSTVVLGTLAPGSMCDDLTLLGAKHHVIQRSGRDALYVARAEIDLPPGWVREHRKSGTRPPWSDLPPGWKLSGHHRWAYRPLTEAT